MAISSPLIILVPTESHLVSIRQSPKTRLPLVFEVYRTQVDVTKTTATDLSADSVLVPNPQILWGEGTLAMTLCR